MGWFGRCRCYLSRRLSRPVRAALVVAGLFLGPGALILGEEAVYWATSTRVEGTVVGHEPYGKSKGYRPVVEYQWGGQTYRCRSGGQTVWAGSEPIPVGTTIAVFVSRDGPSSSRLGIPFQWLFLPCWACLFPGSLFLLGAVVAIVWGQPEDTEPGSALSTGDS
ncbi:MAG TPA: DUF3592 domain-containing protein [Fimbriiglobus sp.]|nr:DUF3592 domain-containing protein [Fimbriiglobus sp.]